MMLSLIFYIIIFIIISVILSLFFFPFIMGAPFQPSSRRRLEIMMRFANIRRGDKVADLGSGNGRVVIEFAKRGAIAHGYEINPLLVWYSRWRIRRLGLQKRAKIYMKSFWKVNLRGYDVISLFQIFFVMSSLKKKLKRELKSGSRIVSNTWKFPGWKPVRKEKEVFLYRV